MVGPSSSQGRTSLWIWIRVDGNITLTYYYYNSRYNEREEWLCLQSKSRGQGQRCRLKALQWNGVHQRPLFYLPRSSGDYYCHEDGDGGDYEQDSDEKNVDRKHDLVFLPPLIV